MYYFPPMRIFDWNSQGDPSSGRPGRSCIHYHSSPTSNGFRTTGTRICNLPFFSFFLYFLYSSSFCLSISPLFVWISVPELLIDTTPRQRERERDHRDDQHPWSFLNGLIEIEKQRREEQRVIARKLGDVDTANNGVLLQKENIQLFLEVDSMFSSILLNNSKLYMSQQFKMIGKEREWRNLSFVDELECLCLLVILVLKIGRSISTSSFATSI